MADLSRGRERRREEMQVSALHTLVPKIRVRARQGRVGLGLGQGWAWVA